MSEFKLVPERMLLDRETIGAINFHCGDGGDNFGEHSDGLLWVGAVTDDDGQQVYGLHLATAEYPEEGSTTLVEFNAPEDAAQSELAALREELAKYRNLNDSLIAVNLELANCKDTYKKLREKKVAAEQRNAELVELLKRAKPYIPWNRFGSSQYQWNTEVQEALKPTESGASE